MVSMVEGGQAPWSGGGRGSMTRDGPLPGKSPFGKYFAGEAVVKAAGMAMEVHGGMGYSLEMPVEKYYRDAKLYQVGEGTANYHAASYRR